MSPWERRMMAHLSGGAMSPQEMELAVAQMSPDSGAVGETYPAIEPIVVPATGPGRKYHIETKRVPYGAGSAWAIRQVYDE